MFESIGVLWKFSRPHTIIGSTISIIVLWLMALQNTEYRENVSLLLWTLLAGISCNIFIVGLNQIIDIELDKINKPHLPLANGSLTVSNAYFIIMINLLLTLFISFLTSVILAWLIVVILLIGIAYSVPPIQLKKHHLPASLAITIVRGVLVNVGMYLHFSYASGQVGFDQIIQAPLSVFSEELWMLTGFVVAFSIAIAWFKDLPDTEGDAQFKFNTLALAYSPKAALYGGVILVGLAYLITIIWALLLNNLMISGMHMIAFTAFLVNVWFVDLSVPKTITRFYMIFWIFFFLEYSFFGINAIF
jgi:homogentisate phytyltransferase / homogentisate geranylgeranyltransferase